MFKLSTRKKIYIAYCVYKILRLFGVKRHRIKAVNGVRYSLDLAEGIDLSIFLFGAFQKHVLINSLERDEEPTSIIDIGANSGTVSLYYANEYNNARIYSFEPSTYALQKFSRNLELNPSLSNRIVVIKAFVGENQQNDSGFISYASWPVDRLGGNRHPIHMGQSSEATDDYTSIDKYCSDNLVTNTRLIKIDTDGYEYEVIRGALNTIKENRPVIIFELSLYELERRNIDFNALVEPLKSLNYTLVDAKTRKEINNENVKGYVSKGGTIDVLATPI
ncbi:MAG: FkbM family methyltransferase [Bacteroidia bacterium]|nr:FkbM family methyltransferase [Bacteroidia bacterium]